MTTKRHTNYNKRHATTCTCMLTLNLFFGHDKDDFLIVSRTKFDENGGEPSFSMQPAKYDTTYWVLNVHYNYYSD